MKIRLPGAVAERLLVPPLRAALILTRQARTLGAIGIIVTPQDQVLLVRTWYRARWGLPGGYFRRRETPAEAVSREIHEETGLTIPTWDGPPLVVFQERRRHIDFIFRTTLVGGLDAELSGDPHEITALQWFPFDALPDLQPEAEAALLAAGLGPRPASATTTASPA